MCLGKLIRESWECWMQSASLHFPPTHHHPYIQHPFKWGKKRTMRIVGWGGGGGEAIKEIKKWKHEKIVFSPTNWHISDTWLCVSLLSETHGIATFSKIHPLHPPFTVCLLCNKCLNQMSMLCRQHSWHQKTLHGYRDFLNQL